MSAWKDHKVRISFQEQTSALRVSVLELLCKPVCLLILATY